MIDFQRTTRCYIPEDWILFCEYFQYFHIDLCSVVYYDRRQWTIDYLCELLVGHGFKCQSQLIIWQHIELEMKTREKAGEVKNTNIYVTNGTSSRNPNECSASLKLSALLNTMELFKRRHQR
jgi:hypothetical protein